jgi:nitrogenase molybdenum-iron protein alpha chain
MSTPTDPALSAEELRSELLEDYPKKSLRKRSKQILINDPVEPPEIGANSRTIPGVITQRGCCYAGCRGVVIGPIYDIVHITHGPIGCGFYSWMTRRNLARPKDGVNFMQYSMSTDMQEEEIVFGGEKKLMKAIDEAVSEFNPKGIAIYATCPVGLIGDDIHSVAREAMKKYPKVNIMGFSCEGYKGVSQSAGHHIANNKVFTSMVGLDDTPQTKKYTINILGEYNIGGDAWEIDAIMEKCGIHVVGTLSGDVSYDDIANCHTIDLNTVMCHRSINYMAEMMETKYGIPWIKVNFIGADATAKSLRKIAAYFEDEELMARVENVISCEMNKIKATMENIKARLKGKKVMALP